MAVITAGRLQPPTDPTERLSAAIRRGHYATKQIHCSDPLIAWSHSRRFATAIELAEAYMRPGDRMLDHGCGDGTFLAMLLGGQTKGITGVGSEIGTELVADCRDRFAGIDRLEFLLRDELAGPEHLGSYDLVMCMEVLEHVVEVDAELDLLNDVLKPGGVLIISVPVETGLPLLAKQMIRRIAGWRGLGDYPGDSPYTLRELVASVFAGPEQHMERPTFPTGDLPPHHTHKGFNWMVLRERIESRFQIERVLATPFLSLPPYLNSQAWFIARKRSG